MRMAAVFILVLAILVAACGASDSQSTATPVATAASTDSAVEQRIATIENNFDAVKRGRVVSEGWVAEVRPGDVRGTSGIVSDLGQMKFFSDQLWNLHASDRTGKLQDELRRTMIRDCDLLLRSALRNQELWALEQFLRFAQDLDVEPESQFGIKPADLRVEALAIAKKEVAELRPRLREESSDAAGLVSSILREWAFTPKELGLTAEDMKVLGR